MMQDVPNFYRLIMVDHGIQKWKMAHMSLVILSNHKVRVI